MNVFYLDHDPIKSAQMHCDKHVVKMIIEYAQILSTAHRFLDGEMWLEDSANTNRKIKRWRLNDDREDVLYKVAHLNHPSTVWARQSNNNYTWLYCMWNELCKEYTFRYGRIHETERKLKGVLHRLPNNIKVGYHTQPPPAMGKFPQCIIPGDSLKSYHKYYQIAKRDFARWTKREVPAWYNTNDSKVGD